MSPASLRTTRAARSIAVTVPSTTRTFGRPRNRPRIGQAMSAGDSDAVAT